MKITQYLVAFGRVQGVDFRACLHREAKVRRVTGWVRNRKDDSLEAMLQGEKSAVALLVAGVKQSPIGAQVDHVNTAEGIGGYEYFTILLYCS